ncbi:MAG: hypothetical protein Alis3KO_14790 [Aliiglaciecola sp.]
MANLNAEVCNPNNNRVLATNTKLLTKVYSPKSATTKVEANKMDVTNANALVLSSIR